MEFVDIANIVDSGLTVAVLVWLLIAERKRSDLIDERNQKFQFRMIEYFLQSLNRVNQMVDHPPDEHQTRVKINPEFSIHDADEYFRERE